MLRTIQNHYLLPRLLSFQSSNDGADVTPSIGALLGTYSRPGAGINRLTLNAPNFHRRPVMVCTPGSDAALGGYAVLGADTTTQVLDPQLLDASGVADDGILHALTLGWLSGSTDYYQNKQQIHTVFDRPRMIGFRVEGGATPTLSIGSADAVVQLITTGDYMIVFNKPFNRVPNVVASLASTAGGIKIQQVSRQLVRVRCTNASGTLTHNDVNLLVMGSDALVEQHDLRRAVKATHVKPELIGLHISVSGGTPSLTIGSEDASVADTGTGVFTVTLGKTFARNVIPVATASNRVHTTSEDENSFVLNCTDDGGSAEDPTDVSALVLAYGDANEYYQG